MTVYGLIEWRDSLNPTLVVGDSEQAVKHTAAQVIIAWDEDNTLPWLGFNPTSDEVDVWLEKVADMDCEPFFNIVAPADVVTADPVEVNNQEFNV